MAHTSMNNKISIFFMGILIAVLAMNQFQINSLHKMMLANHSSMNQQSSPGAQAQSVSVGESADQVAAKILPKGVPAGYDAELAVSFDNAAAAINVLAPFEQDTRENKLEGENLERYIAMGGQATCEFCCGARTMVNPDGTKACGCAHSAAMRGISAYMLENYGNLMSNDQILEEVNKWKAAFFPGPTVEKYMAASGQGGSGAGLQGQVGGC